MKLKPQAKQIWTLITSAGAIILSLLLLNPFHSWMPSMIERLVLALMVAVSLVVVMLLLVEQPADERDEQHLYKAARAGYAVGVFGLSAALVIESISGYPHPSIIFVLIAMLTVRNVTYWWMAKNQ